MTLIPLQEFLEDLNKIQNISKISTAYSVDILQLKSKEHLIFN